MINLFRKIKLRWLRVQHRLDDGAGKVAFPASGEIRPLSVALFFLAGVTRGSLNIRAAAIAYQFLLAAPLAALFLFSIVPYVPVEGLQGEIIGLVRDLLPANAFDTISSTVTDALTTRRSLPFLGLVLAIFFAGNGINNTFKAFEATVHEIRSPTRLARRRASFGVVALLLLISTVASALVIFGRAGALLLVRAGIIGPAIAGVTALIVRWIVLVAIVYSGLLSLYSYASAGWTNLRPALIGAAGATLLIISGSAAFSFYINSFGQYNRLFGSIGTLIVILLWMRLNALSVLLGFELNASLRSTLKLARRRPED